MILRPVLRASHAELLHAPVRLGLVAVFFLVELASGATHPGPASSGHGLWFGLIIGAGLIGRPRSNGTLALLFTRPVRRVDYVVTRWFAASSVAVLCVGVLQLLLAAEEIVRAGRLDGASLALAVGEDALSAAGVVAVLIFLSTLVGGIGDAALWMALLLASALSKQLGDYYSHPSLSWFGTRLKDVLVPALDLATTFSSSPPSWYAVAAYLSTVAICLAGAVELVRRREISYASGGD